MGLRDQIKAVVDINVELVTVPQWDVVVEVHSMTALSRAFLLNTAMDDNGQMIMDRFHAGVIIACCFDPETKERLFEDSDAKWLMDKSSGAIDLLAGKAMELSGLTPGASKEIEKN